MFCLKIFVAKHNNPYSCLHKVHEGTKRVNSVFLSSLSPLYFYRYIVVLSKIYCACTHSHTTRYITYFNRYSVNVIGRGIWRQVLFVFDVTCMWFYFKVGLGLKYNHGRIMLCRSRVSIVYHWMCIVSTKIFRISSPIEKTKNDWNWGKADNHDCKIK